ncbi:hypothetical protein LTR84_007040 [Exophiala bonariae]|uniref:Major facilitator superfamily (MFS) profile domain-containing protein n=1 Tax=Exophiala bonariae TaxID=1690606 RepID=A0AAV9N1N0_9EURO|nr:hypothetical protein LTR84_007040 [Exophiala bonariae]
MSSRNHALVVDGADKGRGMARVRGCFNGRLLYACSLIALSQVNFGMDQAAFSNTQAMDPFIRKFGVLNAKTQKYAIEPYFLSFLNSFTYIGFAFGLVTGNIISRKFGRKIAMFTMCLWAMVGAIILVTSQHKEQMLVGRIVAYVYIGMELALVPVLQSELTPAPVRGLVVGTYQSGLLLGQLIMSLICRGTSTIKDDRSWRIPLGLFFIVPSIIAVGVWFMNESPRWLLLKGREEEAKASLQGLREGKFTQAQIDAEMEEIKMSLQLDQDKGSLKEVFYGTNFKRTLIVIGVNIFLQLTGQNFASVYGTVFIKSIGTVNPFTMTSINTALNIVMVLITQLLTDVTGRVPQMAAGAAVQCAVLFTMGGLGTTTPQTKPIGTGIVAMVTLFGVGFSLGWAPLSHVVAAEIPTTRLRDATYALGSIFNIAIQFTVSFSIPYLLDDKYAGLHSKVGFIFGSTAFCAFIFSLTCIPECRGKTLEEIDHLFLEKVPIGKFGKTHPRTLQHSYAVAEDKEFGQKVRVDTL